MQTSKLRALYAVYYSVVSCLMQNEVSWRQKVHFLEDKTGIL